MRGTICCNILWKHINYAKCLDQLSPLLFSSHFNPLWTLFSLQCNSFQHSAEYGIEDSYDSNELERDLSSWDDSLRKSTQEFQHQSYNILTCNCHSFVANCLNRLGFQAGRWNVVNLAIFIFLNGSWVSKSAFVKSYLPFIIVFVMGLTFGGWSFITYLAAFVFLLVGWFVLGSYCFKKLIYVQCLCLLISFVHFPNTNYFLKKKLSVNVPIMRMEMAPFISAKLLDKSSHVSGYVYARLEINLSTFCSS